MKLEVKLQFLRYVIPLKTAEMWYTFERTLLEVSTTLKSIFNGKKKAPLPTSLQDLEKVSLRMIVFYFEYTKRNAIHTALN